jgi:hypothetical protein
MVQITAARANKGMALLFTVPPASISEGACEQPLQPFACIRKRLIP